MDEVPAMDQSDTNKKEDLGGAGDGALSEGDVDLKEHMVGILFSRSKLTHLQKQVSRQVVVNYMKNKKRKTKDGPIA